jgi:3-phenylpropionate/trans-cinnamate dioxygenase ferredoxin reductase component
MRVVVIGSGIAGSTCAASLARKGSGVRVTIACGSTPPVYDRTELSKKFLAGTTDEPRPIYTADDFAGMQVSLANAPVAEIDLDRHRCVLTTGRPLEWDYLVLATGSVPHRPSMPGAYLSGVVTLRSRNDARALRGALRHARSIVIIGGGLIGLEVAAVARSYGCQVSLFELQDVLLSRIAPEPIGAAAQQLHEDNGVSLYLHTSVSRILGDERVRAVTTDSHHLVPADLVLIATGTVPTVDLATSAGLEVNDGIVVDTQLRAIGHEDVFAVGDTARVNHHPLFGVSYRGESWLNALRQGEVAANVILGSSEEFVDVPWCWSDQPGAVIQAAGLPDGCSDWVTRGDPTSPDGLAAFALDQRCVRAAVAIGPGPRIGRTIALAVRAIERAATVDPDALANTGIPLRTVLARSAQVRSGDEAIAP